MGFFSKIFGGRQQNPADAGMGYLNQIPAQTGQYYKPFIEGGQQASAINDPINERMSRDPNEFLNSIMRNYKPSEGYKFKEDRMTRAAQNDAAQGGFIGTPYSQEKQSEMVQGLLGGDMQDFLSNILGIQSSGMQGQEKRINNGFSASTGYGDILGSNLGQQAGAAFQGAQQRNQQVQDRRNNFFKLLSNGIQASSRIAGGM